MLYLIDNILFGYVTNRNLSIAITVKLPILANPMVVMNHAYLKLMNLVAAITFNKNVIFLFAFLIRRCHLIIAKHENAFLR